MASGDERPVAPTALSGKGLRIADNSCVMERNDRGPINGRNRTSAIRLRRRHRGASFGSRVF